MNIFPSFLYNIMLIAKDKAKIILNYQHTRLLAEPSYNDDLYVVSFPKSGATWMAFLMANIHLKMSGDSRDVTFFNVHSIIPDIHFSRYIREGTLSFPSIRVLKSHAAFNPYYKNVVYLIRDPEDVMISYYHYLVGLDEYSGKLGNFIRSPIYGIHTWIDHVNSWMDDAPASTRITFIKYEELKHDAAGALKRVYSLMGYDLDDDVLRDAIEKASFDQMKLLEGNYGYGGRDVAKKLIFMRKGKIGEGKKEMCEDDLAYIRKMAGKWMEKFGYE